MASKNRRGVDFPKRFMKRMKKQKRKKLRNTPVDFFIVEQELNNAERNL